MKTVFLVSILLFAQNSYSQRVSCLPLDCGFIASMLTQQEKDMQLLMCLDTGWRTCKPRPGPLTCEVLINKACTDQLKAHIKMFDAMSQFMRCKQREVPDPRDVGKVDV